MRRWIFWFVTWMHISWAFVGLTVDGALEASWLTSGLHELLGSTLVVSMVYLFVGVLAMAALIKDPFHVKPYSLFMIVPQQFLLVLGSATGIGQIVSVDTHAPNLIIDLVTGIMATIWHTVAIISTYMRAYGVIK